MPAFDLPADLAAVFAPLAAARTEIAIFAYLDRQRRILGIRHAPSALSWRVDLPVRTIAGDALAFDASAVVMAHNHPSGDPTPTAADLGATRLLARMLALLEAPLLEHLIVAGDRTTSLRARGLL